MDILRDSVRDGLVGAHPRVRPHGWGTKDGQTRGETDSKPEIRLGNYPRSCTARFLNSPK
jgi:hypothetical protein